VYDVAVSMSDKFKPSDTYEGLLVQANALNNLYKSQLRITDYYKQFSPEKVEHLQCQLDSEREANETLTNEVELLRAEVVRLQDELKTWEIQGVEWYVRKSL